MKTKISRAQEALNADRMADKFKSSQKVENDKDGLLCDLSSEMSHIANRLERIDSRLSSIQARVIGEADGDVAEETGSTPSSSDPMVSIMRSKLSLIVRLISSIENRAEELDAL